MKIFLSISLLLMSCIGKENTNQHQKIIFDRACISNSMKITEQKKDTLKKDTLKLSNSINKIEVRCLMCGDFISKSSAFSLSNNNLKIVNIHNLKDVKEIKDRKLINRLISYINQFYIDKEEKIELKRTKRDYIESTDYPFIKVIGYQGGKEVFSTETQIGEEDYDMEYNPKFLEFYEFLDSLVKEK